MNRFQPVNARSHSFRCNAREGTATSLAGNGKRVTAGVLAWGFSRRDREANSLRPWMLEQNSKPTQMNFMAKVSAKIADTLL